MAAPEIERRALALFERLADAPNNARLRARLTKNEAPEVLDRLAALEARAVNAAGMLPTLIPGSGEFGEGTLPPARVGAFRLTERIGIGGMGEVWAGERDDGLYDQKVAIKLIQRHALVRAAAAFDDERRFLARLDHPNIARLIDGGVTEDGLPWLVMDYVQGEPIDAACAARSLAERVSLFIKAADAVQYAHGKLIAHADLKPGNILVSPDGRVRLLDFGISGLVGQDSRSPTGSGPLTKAFASPQRIAGAPPSVADDIFALGRTLAMLVADDAELMAIAAKAQAVTEGDRYQTVAALIADLDRWRAHLPVRAMPQGWRYRASKFIGRHRRSVMAAGVALTLIAGASLVATRSYVLAEQASARSTQRLQEVRQLARYLLFDLHDDLAREPGTLKKRIEIATVAARYLNQLREAKDAPPDLRLEVAQGYRRLATIQGLGGGVNLGDVAAARKTIDLARDMLDRLLADDPHNAAALAERGWVEQGYWVLGADNRASIAINNRARALFDRALALDPKNAEARIGRLTVERNRAYDLTWTLDRPAEAILVCREALARLRAQGWPKEVSEQAELLDLHLLNRLGDAVYFAGDVPGSLKPYQEADAAVDRLIARDGKIPAWRLMKAEIAFNLSGTLQEAKGRLPESLRVAEQGVKSLRALERFGLDAGTEKRLVMLLGQKAIILGEMGRHADAVTASLESLTIRRKRFAAAPRDPQRTRDVAVAIPNHARILRAAGRTREACAEITEGVRLWHLIRTRGDLSAKDARDDLPETEALQKDFCTG